jgi:hypothetical protein
VIYFDRLKRALSSGRGLHLTFTSNGAEHAIELSCEAADQTLHALKVVTRATAGEKQLTLTVLGHQVVRAPGAYGILLRTQEFGDIVFSLPQSILRKLINDLMQLESSPTALGKLDCGDAPVRARGKIGARH